MRFARIGARTGYLFLFCVRPRRHLRGSVLLGGKTSSRAGSGSGGQHGRRVAGQWLPGKHGGCGGRSSARHPWPRSRMGSRSNRAGLTRPRTRPGSSSAAYRRKLPIGLLVLSRSSVRIGLRPNCDIPTIETIEGDPRTVDGNHFGGPARQSGSGSGWVKLNDQSSGVD
jgi:hypothetical protein